MAPIFKAQRAFMSRVASHSKCSVCQKMVGSVSFVTTLIRLVLVVVVQFLILDTHNSYSIICIDNTLYRTCNRNAFAKYICVSTYKLLAFMPNDVYLVRSKNHHQLTKNYCIIYYLSVMMCFMHLFLRNYRTKEAQLKMSAILN